MRIISFISILYMVTHIVSVSFASEFTQEVIILSEHPKLLQDVFGTTEIKKLQDKSFMQSKLKSFATETKEYGKIIAASVIAAIAYGIINDQVTARVCLEYFSKGFHEQMMNEWVGIPFLDTCREILINTSSPTVYAFIWGTIATWWVGLPLGIILAGASRVGSWPKLTAQELIKPLACTMTGVGIASLMSGIYGYFAHKSFFNNFLDTLPANEIDNTVFVSPSYMDGVSVKNGLRFMANGYAHNAAYTFGIIGGLALAVYALHKRYKKNQEQVSLTNSV